MKRIFLAVFGLFVSGAAVAQPVPAPAISQLRSAPVHNGDLLSVKGQAPRRNLMTMSPNTINAEYTTTFDTLHTYSAFLSIEANAYAVRVAFADPYYIPMQIVSATVYPTDSYAGAVLNGAVWTSNTNTTIFPTQNSVFMTCTLATSTTVTCPSTASLPSAATMYVIGPQGDLPVDVTATVTNGTTVTLSSAALVSGSVGLQFANKSTGCTMYFDNQGSAVDTINTSGVATSLMVAGRPGNTNISNSVFYPFTLVWTDFSPCTSVPRADGQTTQLFAIYATFGPQATTMYGSGSSIGASYNTTIAPTLGGRYTVFGNAWNGSADYANNPTGTGMKWMSNSPVMAVQYMTDARGYNVVQSGDSISASPPDDNMSTPVYRACKLLSTPQLPCEWSNFAWGGQSSNQYDEDFRNNIATFKPSALVFQPISRNDYTGVISSSFLASMQDLVAKSFSYAASLDARVGFYGAFPFPSPLDGDTIDQTAVATMRSRLAVISKSCQPNTGGQSCPMVPVLDPVPIVSRAVLGGNFWDYLGTGSYATSAAAAGATSIAIAGGTSASPSAQGSGPCYAGDLLTDTTNPAVIATGATATSSTTTSIAVPSTAIIGAGISSGDNLVCSFPGWSGGALTRDNTHPWYGAVTLLQPTANTFLQQLLGLQ